MSIIRFLPPSEHRRTNAPPLDPANLGGVFVAPCWMPELLGAVGEFVGTANRVMKQPLPVACSPLAFPKHSALIHVKPPDTSLPADGFSFDISKRGVSLSASNARGIRYALQWLLTTLCDGDGRMMESCRGRDIPCFARRGVMLDISRCRVPTMECLFDLVRRLAALRINELQLYTEHTYAFARHPAVWRDASPMEPMQLLALDAHCRSHGIELVPNFNSFGHWERWLKHPEYRSFSECPAGSISPWGRRHPFGTVLRPTKRSLALLSALYDDLLPHFSAQPFNVGCDETWELGQGASRSLVAQKGMHRVYLDFLLDIHRLAAKRGRTIQFWGDIILKAPALIDELPQDSTALCWGYEADHPFAHEALAFAQSGRAFYVCPGTSSWNSLAGRTENARANILHAAHQGHSHRAHGLLVTDWGDNGHHQPAPVSYYGFTLAALAAWNPHRAAEIDAVPLTASAFFDGDLHASRFFFEAGKILETIQHPFVNSSPFHHLLFAHGKDRERLAAISLPDLRSAHHAVLERMPDAGAISDHFISSEAMLVLRMMEWGLRRELAARNLAPGPPSIPRLKASILRTFRACWLERSRPGGLAESESLLAAIPP